MVVGAVYLEGAAYSLDVLWEGCLLHWQEMLAAKGEDTSGAVTRITVRVIASSHFQAQLVSSISATRSLS
jgi:hypothetical protein